MSAKGETTKNTDTEITGDTVITSPSINPEAAKNFREAPNRKEENYFHLRGVFRIGGQRNFSFPVRNKNYFLVCNRFWKEEVLAVCVTEDGVNLLEMFTVTNDQQFLEKVSNNYLHLELSKINNKSTYDVIGLLRLPLHQFFVAYRDATITNHLLNGQFPVLSTDTWVPISNVLTGEKTGEVECLLAIGTEKQIENIRLSRDWKLSGLILPMNVPINKSQTSVQIGNNLSLISTTVEKPNIANLESKSMPQNLKKDNTSVLAKMLQSPLTNGSSTLIFDESLENLTGINSIVQSVRISLEIKSAINLPLNPPLKIKKKVKRSAAGKERNIPFPPGEEPNTYVTFQAEASHGSMVKSHEGMVYSTHVIEKTCNPNWNKSFCIAVSLDYLMNKNKRFILKIWKNATNFAHSRPLPCPMEDSIIGFAAIDFINLLANVPFTGWFNIVDFNGHINGQINVTAQPIDDLQKLNYSARNRRESQVDSLLDSFESSLNINNANLSRAIKRKFTELEGISQRLRARLLDVTGNAESDEQLDEFEHDLNTIAYEDENEIDNISSPINFSTSTSQSSPHMQ